MDTPVLQLDSQKKSALDAGFAAAFGGTPARYFSAPGRTEIGGNHTDHQRGRVLAAAVNLDTVAAVRENGTDKIRILSAGYPRCEIDVKELTPRKQNVIPAGCKSRQDVALALAMCEHFLAGRGAYRVHGGGFAGTVQAFVPLELLDAFCAGMNGVLGEGVCHVLRIRPLGGVEMRV